MKISLITAVLNRRSTIQDTLNSVKSQSYNNIEHVIIDGASKDGTLDLLRKYSSAKTVLVSEKDSGIYHALNKGIAHATGDVIGLVHSDDILVHDDILTIIAEAFTNPSIDAVYGDLQYVSAIDTTRVVRHWKAGKYADFKLARGWMPPHPTLFVRKSVFEKFGVYDTSYRISADYDAILRWFGSGQINTHYIPEVFVKMRVGGESNKSLQKVIQKSREDYRALRSNKIGGLGALAWKNASKIGQFFIR